MGFGTLFVGYFLLLNVTHYRGFTDIIAAAIMLFALYKLSDVNRGFKLSFILCGVFMAVSLGELVLSVSGLFSLFPTEIATSVITIVRHGVVGTLTALIMLGIKDISREVDLPKIRDRARYLLPSTFTVYLLLIVLESVTGFTSSETMIKIMAWSSLIVIIANITLLVFGLFTIYSCYMQICMPEDNTPFVPDEEKPSRFAFINEHRKKRRARDEAYYKERMDKAKAKYEKKMKGKNDEKNK